MDDQTDGRTLHLLGQLEGPSRPIKCFMDLMKPLTVSPRVCIAALTWSRRQASSSITAVRVGTKQQV